MAGNPLSYVTDTRLEFGDDGTPLVPTDPKFAAARLRALDADPTVQDALLDVSHPQHADRMSERRALLLVAHRKPAG
jgi:hypothetical protein